MILFLPDIYHHDGLECSLRVLKEFFTEEQMVSVHRFFLEIAKANEYPVMTLSDEEMWVDSYIWEEDYVDRGGMM